jgi:hypothetical protein
MLKSHRAKKITKSSNERINKDSIDSYRFYRENKFALHTVFPEYFNPVMICDSTIQKTRISQYIVRGQFTVSNNPHCFIAFTPESVFVPYTRNYKVGSEEKVTHRPNFIKFSGNEDGLTEPGWVFPDMKLIFSDIVIISSFVKVNFTRQTNSFYQIASWNFEKRFENVEFDEKQRTPDCFVYRYKLPDYTYTFKKAEKMSANSTVIHMYGLETGLVLDYEASIVIQGTPATDCPILHEFQKTTPKNDSKAKEIRMIKRLYENMPISLLDSPLKNPINDDLFVNIEIKSESGASFLFPTKNEFIRRNVCYIQNIQTVDGVPLIKSAEISNQSVNEKTIKNNNSIGFDDL